MEQNELKPLEEKLTRDDVQAMISSYLANVGVYPLTRKYPIGIVVFKNATETRTATTTLANDDSLFFRGEPNTDYLIDMMIFITVTSNGNNGQLNFNFGLPSGATYDAQISKGNSDAPTSVSQVADVSISLGTSGSKVSIIRGVVKIGSTGGSVNWKWLADKSTPSDTVTVAVNKGSWMSYKKLIYEDRPQK